MNFEFRISNFKWLAVILAAGCWLLASAPAQTNRTPILRGLLQSPLDANTQTITNVGGLRSTNADATKFFRADGVVATPPGGVSSNDWVGSFTGNAAGVSNLTLANFAPFVTNTGGDQINGRLVTRDPDNDVRLPTTTFYLDEAVFAHLGFHSGSLDNFSVVGTFPPQDPLADSFVQLQLKSEMVKLRILVISSNIFLSIGQASNTSPYSIILTIQTNKTFLWRGTNVMGDLVISNAIRDESYVPAIRPDVRTLIAADSSAALKWAAGLRVFKNQTNDADLEVAGNITTVSGDIIVRDPAERFIGNGAGLTNLNLTLSGNPLTNNETRNVTFTGNLIQNAGGGSTHDITANAVAFYDATFSINSQSLNGIGGKTWLTNQTTFLATVTNAALTADRLMGTDANKAESSIAIGSGLSLAGGTLSATGGNPFNQDLNTTDSPTFDVINASTAVNGSFNGPLNGNASSADVAASWSGYKSGTKAIASLATSTTVTFATARADANYAINLTSSGFSTVPAVSYANKAAGSFDIITTAITGGGSVDWSIKPYQDP